MACDDCMIGSFKVADVAQNGTPVTMPDGTPIGTSYSGQTPGAPAWKTANANGTTSVFGLMAWDAFMSGGWCIDEGGTCYQIAGCGGSITLKFMLMIPKGQAPAATVADPNGVNIPQHGTPRKLRGNDTYDFYRMDFIVSLGADCGTSIAMTLNNTWSMTINGVAATFHNPGGTLKFELTCNACDGGAGGDPTGH